MKSKEEILRKHIESIDGVEYVEEEYPAECLNAICDAMEEYKNQSLTKETKESVEIAERFLPTQSCPQCHKDCTGRLVFIVNNIGKPQT